MIKIIPIQPIAPIKEYNQDRGSGFSEVLKKEMKKEDKQALECAKGLKSYCEEYAENDCLGCIFLLNNLGCQDVEKARVFFQDSGKYPFEWTLDKPWRG